MLSGTLVLFRSLFFVLWRCRRFWLSSLSTPEPCIIVNLVVGRCFFFCSGRADCSFWALPYFTTVVQLLPAWLGVWFRDPICLGLAVLCLLGERFLAWFSAGLFPLFFWVVRVFRFLLGGHVQIFVVGLWMVLALNVGWIPCTFPMSTLWSAARELDIWFLWFMISLLSPLISLVMYSLWRTRI